MEFKANVLIDENGHARLTEFGLTSIIREGDSARSPGDYEMLSTTTWAAPEKLKGGVETKEGDIFTFAMVVVEVRERGPFGG
jgi:serine/threonine protein kinase